MAENRLETRILLRYATYNQWMSSEVILQPGEAAIAAFPDNNPNNPPKAIGIKVGDGYHYFDELPWIQAIAADVYNWAKEVNKPTYQATEIVGLADYIAAHSGGGSGGGSAGSGQYQIIWDSTSSKYILQQWDTEDEEWDNTASEIDFSGVLTRLNNIERWANGEKTNLGNIYDPITAIVYEEVLNYINKIDVSDQAVAHQFVTQVRQVDGKIQVQRSIITAADISSGVFTTAQGGTGLSRLESDELLVGSNNGNITTRTFVTQIDPSDRTSFATAGAIIDYVALMTAGLTGAMHFVGEATVAIDAGGNSRVNPQIVGYNFNNAQPGDVILANNTQEFVWTGTAWRLLGDEGSYAIKGSIVNSDINENANISQSKIDGLEDALAGKVDKVEGKGLSSNDYSDEDKDKLDSIDEGAQVNAIEHILVNDTEVNISNKTVNLQIPLLTQEQLDNIDAAQANVIEHIFVNGTELNPHVINQLPKSVGIDFTVYTQEEKEKLAEIEAEAQVNKVESIVINGTSYTPNNQKQVEITIDQAALNLNVIEGARVPGETAGQYEDVDITSGTKKLQLARVAKTGNIKDILQSNNEYIILYCGTSTDVI